MKNDIIFKTKSISKCQFQTFVQCNKILMFISNYENYRKNMRILFFYTFFHFFLTFT